MIIYKITNEINGKVYIGQTTRPLNQRWWEHLKPSRYKKSALTAAIQKYGKESFIVEEIDGANSLSELNYLEKHYIYKHRTLSPNGYNLLSGGGNLGRHSKESIKKMRVPKKSKINYVGKKGKENHLFGMVKSEDHIAKLKKIHTGSNNTQAKKVVDLDTGKIWGCAKDCALELGYKYNTLKSMLNGANPNKTGLRYVGQEHICKPFKRGA